MKRKRAKKPDVVIVASRIPLPHERGSHLRLVPSPEPEQGELFGEPLVEAKKRPGKFTPKPVK